MPFQCKYIPACKYDLSHERIDIYNKIVAIVQMYGKAGIFREGIIVNVMRMYPALSDDEIVHRIERFCARPTTSLDKLDAMMTGVEPLVWTKEQDRPKVQPPVSKHLQTAKLPSEPVGSIGKIDLQSLDISEETRKLVEKFSKK